MPPLGLRTASLVRVPHKPALQAVSCSLHSLASSKPLYLPRLPVLRPGLQCPASSARPSRPPWPGERPPVLVGGCSRRGPGGLGPHTAGSWLFRVQGSGERGTRQPGPGSPGRLIFPLGFAGLEPLLTCEVSLEHVSFKVTLKGRKALTSSPSLALMGTQSCDPIDHTPLGRLRNAALSLPGGRGALLTCVPLPEPVPSQRPSPGPDFKG